MKYPVLKKLWILLLEMKLSKSIFILHLNNPHAFIFPLKRLYIQKTVKEKELQIVITESIYGTLRVNRMDRHKVPDQAMTGIKTHRENSEQLLPIFLREL